MPSLPGAHQAANSLETVAYVSVLLGLCVGVLLTTGQISPIQALVIGIAGIAAIKLATSIQVANTTELQKADRSSD